ncbi:MAG: SRPBCC family protein [Planctomycetes bacterium]|nr:SRPBCC family protein [Planctomycetota bacterium]
MLIPILVTLAILVALFVVVVSIRPNTFQVIRSATMTTPPDKPFALVNDFHNWEKWSPWAKLDPTMKQTYEGPASGVGASYGWNGNNNVGEGKQTILESQPAQRIKIQLEFFRPFRGTNEVEFTFQPQGTQTVVTWTMQGTYNFITKAMGLFLSMDQMIGGNFEQGLAAMKAEVEAAG